MFDPLLIIPLLLLAVMLIFMWRGNKKRAEQQAQVRESMVVGADVMTQAGIYGTIVDLDTENNVATLEVAPGTNIRVHSQTLLQVVTPTVPDDASELTADAADDGLPAPAVSFAKPSDDEAQDESTEAEAGDADSDDTTDSDSGAAESNDGDDDSKSGPLGEYRGDK